MSLESWLALIFAGLERRSIMLVIPPHLRASEITFQPCIKSFVAYSGLIPSETILSKQTIVPACSIPQRIVCSPIRSDLTSATKEDSRTPALLPPIPTARAFAIAQPFPSGSFAGCTAIRSGTPNPRWNSCHTSVPGPFGAHMITVISGRICIPSSIMLNPCEYQRAEPFFIFFITSVITGVCCLSGVRLPTKSAVGIISS